MAEGEVAPGAGAGGGPALPMTVLERMPCGCQRVMTVRGEQVKPCLPCAITLALKMQAQATDLMKLVAKLQREREDFIAAERVAANKAAIDAALRGT